MIDIGNDNLDNELNIEKYKAKILRSGELIDLRTDEEIMGENKVYNPKELEYWRNIFPNKTDNELEEYRTRWSKENPKYLKFKNL